MLVHANPRTTQSRHLNNLRHAATFFQVCNVAADEHLHSVLLIIPSSFRSIPTAAEPTGRARPSATFFVQTATKRKQKRPLFRDPRPTAAYLHRSQAHHILLVRDRSANRSRLAATVIPVPVTRASSSGDSRFLKAFSLDTFFGPFKESIPAAGRVRRT
jgi:hypothetical protein